MLSGAGRLGSMSETDAVKARLQVEGQRTKLPTAQTLLKGADARREARREAAEAPRGGPLGRQVPGGRMMDPMGRMMMELFGVFFQNSCCEQMCALPAHFRGAQCQHPCRLDKV